MFEVSLAVYYSANYTIISMQYTTKKTTPMQQGNCRHWCNTMSAYRPISVDMLHSTQENTYPNNSIAATWWHLYICIGHSGWPVYGVVGWQLNLNTHKTLCCYY